MAHRRKVLFQSWLVGRLVVVVVDQIVGTLVGPSGSEGIISSLPFLGPFPFSRILFFPNPLYPHVGMFFGSPSRANETWKRSF